MIKKKIKFEGKIKINESISAAALLKLLAYLYDEKGFKTIKYKPDEIKLINEINLNNSNETKSSNKIFKVEIEIEVSEKEIEIEVESENLELVKEISTDIAGKI